MAMMNDYETRRLERIKANQVLLAELDIKPVVTRPTLKADSDPPAAKRRMVLIQDAAPPRTSARIAAVPVKPMYNEDAVTKLISLPRSAPRRSRTSRKHVEEPDPLVLVSDVESIRADWTAWEATGDPPARDNTSKTFHFADFPAFRPNKSPAEMLREGCFGGSYYRPLGSRKLGITIRDDWKELPQDWIEGLDVARFLISPTYDADFNKYKVSCGQSIEEWEAAGWISHADDVRGWFQWYTRFFQGRRCDDDARQVSRWRKCVGETGRWRRMLLKRYMAAGVREVFDDGADEDAPEVSPVMHQTCHHWAFEVRQSHLDELWANGGR
ncbi:hypothetical protein LTR53_001571 [Teratosphaeriaceae sp. CCFEE 6253]|nr:hypothetical protein LTR53_001571 [Teratosphaeriaceae sp. CCFEE 6253]